MLAAYEALVPYISIGGILSLGLLAWFFKLHKTSPLNEEDIKASLHDLDTRLKLSDYILDQSQKHALARTENGIIFMVVKMGSKLAARALEANQIKRVATNGDDTHLLVSQIDMGAPLLKIKREGDLPDWLEAAT